MLRHISLTALGGTLSLAFPAFAQSSQTTDQIVVTAVRLPQPLAMTPDAHVITAEDIENRGAVFAADLLADVPGVIIGENGFGGVSSLSLRGASSDKTLVLIDGVPVNDPSQPQGPFDFSSLDVASTERIEVLSGPQGSLWGSDAIGGVVSITSKEPDGLAAYGEAGSLSTWREGVSFGRAAQAWAAGASLSGFRTAGVPNADEKYGNTQPDGFNDFTANLNGRVQLGEQVTLQARVRYVQSGEEYDIFCDPRFVVDATARNQVRSASGFVGAQIKDVLGFDQELRADLMGIDRRYFGQFPFDARGDQQVYRWIATRQTPVWGLQFGYEHKRAAENTGDGLAVRGADGAFAIGRWSPDDRFNATLSLRRDDPQGYQSQTTARLAAAYRLAWGFSLLGSVGQGFKAPSLYETTYPCFECATPGPAKTLRAERAVGEDAALNWRSDDGALEGRVTAFGLSVTDQIDYIYPVGYLNLSKVSSAGLEASGQARLGDGFSLRGSFAYIDATDGTTKAQLLRIPRDSGSGSLDWRGGRTRVEIGFRGQDQAADVDGELGPFLIGYVNASYDLTEHLRVSGRVEDVANTHYEQAFGYGEPGRMVLVGLSWR